MSGTRAIGSALLAMLVLVAAALLADTVKYAYDDAGRLISVDYGNGKTIAYTYDNAGNLLSRVVAGDAQAPAAKRKPADKGGSRRTRRTRR